MSYRKKLKTTYPPPRKLKAPIRRVGSPRRVLRSVSGGRRISYKGELISPSARKSAVDLVAILNTHGIKYVVAGAVPVQFYGRERFSRDVDLILSLDEGSAADLFSLLMGRRYTIIYPLKHEYAIEKPSDLLGCGLIKMRDMKTGSLIDLFLRPKDIGFKFDREALNRAKKIMLNGKEILIPSPEDYLIMKLKSKRPGTQDYADAISTLNNQFEALDWEYLNRRAGEENLTGLLNHYKEAVERGKARENKP